MCIRDRYYDKTSDEIEEIDNEAMRQGREFEDYVAGRFCEASGKKVRRANAMYYDEKNPFMLADVDRMVVGENAGLECKTASPYIAEKWEDGKIPLSYQIQCHHYMLSLIHIFPNPCNLVQMERADNFCPTKIWLPRQRYLILCYLILIFNLIFRYLLIDENQ